MVRVLQLTTHDVTVQKLLLPLIDRLTEEGYDVVSACSPGRYTPELLAQGYSMQAVDMDRRISFGANSRSLWQLFRLMRRGQFDIVHVHTPVAAALGRLAAKLAGVPIIVYTAHGFYFHENMRWRNKQACIWVEKLLGRTATSMLLTQSQEDAETAVKTGIGRAGRVVCIGNGVNVDQFKIGPSTPEAKESFGLPATAPVVGFMGRMVAEKGVFELLDAFQEALDVIPNMYLLMAGDTTDGDRDQSTRSLIRDKVESPSLSSRVVLPGFVEDINRVMEAIDLFVLPSHREGMPRSIIEAMASGKPVVATNIRGCREEVVDGVTGRVVPVRDSHALGQAIVSIMSDFQLARRMGDEGRRRTETHFDENIILDRQVQAYQRLIEERLGYRVESSPRAMVFTEPEEVKRIDGS